MANSTYKIISSDGQEKEVSEKEVSEKEFQDKIDAQLARFNGGKVPTTDEERTVIIERLKKTGMI